MLSERAQKALLDIRENILLAQTWTEGLTLVRFAEDRMVFYAVTRCLEIISEASRRLPPELKRRHSKIEWRGMRDAGNIYRHDYDGVQEHIILRTVREALPPLLRTVQVEINASESDA
ncbi:MAG: DUF86 domain-containing protein [Caulobacter sp.]|nr:DUF86 domain-containing protein [Caulobacter sp.]